MFLGGLFGRAPLALGLVLQRALFCRTGETLDDGEGDDSRSPFQDGGGDGKEYKEERAFKKGLARLLASTHGYVETGRQFAKATAVLGADLQELSSLEWMVSQQISQHVSHIGNLMRSLSAIQDKTVNNIQDACDVPMFQLLDMEAQEMRYLAELRSKAEDAATRHKKKGGEKFVGEGAAFEKNADQARSELEAQIAVLDASKKIKLFRFLRSLVTSEEEFYKMGNFGMAELNPHVAKLDAQLAELEASYGKRCRDGYVWKLSHKMGKWKKVWLVLRNGSLEVRSDTKKKEGRVKEGRKMNLLISTVRVPVVPRGAAVDDNSGSGEKFEFEIVTPERKRGWMFATRSDEERQEWIEALQASIGSLINNQQLQDGVEGDHLAGMRKSNSSREKNSSNMIGMSIIRKVIPGGKGHRKSRSVTSAEAARLMAMSLMQEGSESSVLSELATVPGNDACVDCGKSDPDWASMNLGILFCLNCSGVHRHLGSHISKVRSLTMDKWPEGTLRYMKSVGNRKANEFWEARLPADAAQRLKPTSNQQERTEFITQKYEKKRYALESPLTTRSEVNAALFNAIREVDLAPVVSVAGSAFNTPNVPRRHSPDDEPIHIVVRSNSSGSVLNEPAQDNNSSGNNKGNNNNLGANLLPPMHDLGRDSASPVAPPGGVALLLSPEKLQENIWPLYQWLAWGAELSALHPVTGRTLGQVLLEKKDPWLLHLFVVHGVEVASTDEASGESLLHFAARHNLYECLDVVFTHLGSLSAQTLHGKNAGGETPTDVARANASLRVLDFLTAKEEKLKEKVPASPQRPSAEAGGDGSGGNDKSGSVEEHSPTHPGASDEMAAGQRSPRRGAASGGAGQGFNQSAGELHMGSKGEDHSSESSMQKFLKKATGGHMRSKSVFQAPTNGGGVPRDSMTTPKLGTLSKILRKEGKTGRGPSLTSKTSVSPIGDYGMESHEDDESFTVGTPSATPMRHTSGSIERVSDRVDRSERSSSVSVGEEVAVRAGKRLMKGGKGLDQVAIRQALVVSADKRGGEEGGKTVDEANKTANSASANNGSGEKAVAAREERDLMGFIDSTESSEE